MVESNWYRKTVDELLRHHGTSLAQGLTQKQIEFKRQEFGWNRLPTQRSKSAFRIFASQFADILVIILLVAAVISIIMKEPQDSVFIIVIVMLNSILGFYQEYRAEKAIQALRRLAAPHAKVVREGKTIVLPAYELVPGDLVLLESGDLVPADLRLHEVFGLQVNESTLTGESAPIAKQHRALEGKTLAISDQSNMAFKGSSITGGRAMGVVTEIGHRTQLGKIAQLLREEVEVKTPMQNSLLNFAKKMAVGVVLICILIFLAGIIRGEDLNLMLMTAVSLAVAAVPEALPTVITVSLSFGARIMARKNALVRKLPGIETLGSVTYICSDKTGTLTENKMKLDALFVNQQIINSEAGGLLRVAKEHLWEILALNNDVRGSAIESLEGDPTEIALVEAASLAGFHRADLEKKFPRVAELAFTSERAMMTTIHKVTDKEVRIFAKGSPEVILDKCELDENEQNEILSNVKQLAEKGYRVLALASKSLSFPNELQFESAISETKLSSFETNLNFCALVCLIDPPRKEVPFAISQCQSAGIQTVMITGDHPATAKAIAVKIGILTADRSLVVTGSELALMSDHDLQEKIKKIAVIARATPEQKIKIVKALQNLGEIVAMTGDGVNDAPALKRSNIGIAMGKTGTDVARESSHFILLDDKFETIVEAIREGRRIYDNIRKFVRFALGTNFGEIFTLGLAPLLGLPIPLLPVQILWVNLVTDGLPGLALVAEPAEGSIMTRPPRALNETFFSRGNASGVAHIAVLTGILTILVQFFAIRKEVSNWQTMVFTTLTFIQMAAVLSVRLEYSTTLSQRFWRNRYLIGAVGLTVLAQILALYTEIGNSILMTKPLSAGELSICILIAVVTYIVLEFMKVARFKRK